MIYILEDDDSIRKLVTYALESQGFSAKGFAAPDEFREALQRRVPSLLLLDIMLPQEDGISILKRLRADPRTARLPVIMLTAKGEEYDRVEGLDAGADDYVAKPFGMMELLARVRALLRRAKTPKAPGASDGISVQGELSENGPGAAHASVAGSGPSAGSGQKHTFSGLRPAEEILPQGYPDQMPAGHIPAGHLPAGHLPAGYLPADYSSADHSPVGYVQEIADAGGPVELRFGTLQIFPQRYEVFVDGEAAALTNKEYRLLLLLARNAGIVLTREVLMDRIWDLGAEPENRTLDVHIRKVRTKLGAEGVRIETVRGVGYRFRG